MKNLWIIQCAHLLQLLVRIVLCEEMDSDMPYVGVDKEGADDVKRYEAQIPPFWANRGRRDRSLDEEFGPFWANRGRRRNEEEFELIKRLQHALTPESALLKNVLQHSQDCKTRLQEPLYAEEPHWILVRRDEDHHYPTRNLVKQNMQPGQVGPYFVTRGKRCESHSRPEFGRFE